MIFAALDYLQYRRRKGRFGENQKSGMGLGFLGRFPDEVVAELEIGDFIVTQRLDSWFSWAMLYFSSSAIDHVALYIGDGRIAHVTLSGYKEHSVHVFGPHTRLMAFRLAPPDGGNPFHFEDGYREMERRRRPSHILPPKLQLTWVGARIVAGLHPERFRWKFLVDLLLLGVGIDLISFWITEIPFATVLATIAAILFAMIFGVNQLRLALGAKLERLNHPDLMMRVFGNTGGVMFTSLGPLVASDFGLLPVKAFRALGRKRPEDSPDDELEPLRKHIRDTIKRWNLPVPIEEAENEESNEDNDEKDEERPDSRRQRRE